MVIALNTLEEDTSIVRCFWYFKIISIGERSLKKITVYLAQSNRKVYLGNEIIQLIL